MAVTWPVTAPLIPGAVTAAVPAGLVLAGLTATATGTARVPPWPSVTVMVNASARSAAGALSAEAVWRAVAVGVTSRHRRPRV